MSSRSSAAASPDGAVAAPSKGKRACITDRKEDENLAKSEQKFMQTQLIDEANKIPQQILDHPQRLVPVQSTIASKLRKKGARLYRGDNCIGALAQKHGLAGACFLTGTDPSQWMEVNQVYDVCRLVIQRILKNGAQVQVSGQQNARL